MRVHAIDGRSPTAGEWERVRQVLETRISISLTDVPLRDVAARMSEACHYPITLDIIALEDIGIDGSTLAEVSVSSLKLETALDFLLKPLDLTWTVSHEVILITTEEESEDCPITVVYPVADLLPTTGRSSGSYFVMDSMIDLITNTVEVDSWSDVGGPGTIEETPRDGALVISQSATIHREVDRLLANLRYHANRHSGYVESSTLRYQDDSASTQSRRYPSRPRSRQSSPPSRGGLF